MKRIILFVAILSLCSALASEARPQQRRNRSSIQQRASQTNSELASKIKKFWDFALNKCGDSYFTIDISPGIYSTIYELKGVSFENSIDPLSEIDKMNGYEISGSSWANYKMCRTIADDGRRSEWHGPRIRLNIVFYKKNGTWTSHMNFMTAIRRIECSTIPGIHANDGTRPLKKRQPINVEIPDKLIQHLARNDQSVKQCMDRGKIDKIDKYFSAERIDLNGDGIPDFIVEAQQNPEDCFLCGNRRCTKWVFRSTTDGYELLLTVDGANDVSTLNTSSNGHRDLRVIYPAGNTYPASEEIYKFDGKHYQKWKSSDIR